MKSALVQQPRALTAWARAMFVVCLSLLASTVVAAPTAPNLATVPWLGNPSIPHQVYSGGELVLQGVATDLATGNSLCIDSAEWDTGDGAIKQILAPNGYALEAKHTYNGAVGQPFTARLNVTLCDGGGALSDEMRVVIRPDTQETRVNMTIDKALWFLHKDQVRTSSDGKASSFWRGTYQYYQGATSGAVQAFSINNHRESGNPAEDPYVNTVKRGMRYLLSLSHGTLISHNVAAQYDGNGNGDALEVNQSGHGAYQNGQLIDAIVASGTPDAIAVSNNAKVNGKRYVDIVQDLLDGYSWGQSPTTGGWLYNLSSHRNANAIDTSSSHWWAIGVLAAEVWGLDAPVFIKDNNWLKGIPRVQSNVQPAGCSAGYRSTWLGWDSGRNLTPAALIMMNADDIPKSHERFSCGERWIKNNLSTMINRNNYYALYQTAKAMRTALDENGNTSPVELMDGTLDWYSEMANYFIGSQQADGGFNTVQAYTDTGGWYMTAGGGRGMVSSWAAIILSPSLFELPPTASCNASPLIDGTAQIGGNVNFDGRQSAHPDAEREIVSYSWAFSDGSAPGTGATTSHSFDNVGIYNVVLTVEDDNGNTDTDVCQIDVRDNDIPPAARPGGPYQICLGDTLNLDGSASSDLDNEIVVYEWDWNSPINFASVDSTAISPSVVGAPFTAVGLYDVGLRVTDNDGSNGGSDHTAASFTTVNVIPADDPSCNQPPVALCADVSVEVGEQCLAPASIDGGSSDPDGDPLNIVQNPPGPFALGEHPNVGLSVSDPRGESDNCSATVSVVDTTAPAFTTVPSGFTVEASGNPDTTLTVAQAGGLAFASDDCDATVTRNAVAVGPETSVDFQLGDNPVTWTATDTSGNETTAEQTVTVVDTTPPVLTVPADVTVEADANPLTAVTIGNASAEDLYLDSVTNDAPAAFPLGATTVTWTATDTSGNETTAEQTVTVVDTTPPVLTVPADVTVEADANPLTAVTIGNASAEDLYLDSVTNDAPAAFPLGATTVTWTATDTSGNETTAEQTVTVVDTTAPELTVPADVTVPAEASQTVVPIGNATATDLFAVTIVNDAPASFPVGATTVTWTATDANNNVSTATETVNVWYTIGDFLPPLGKGKPMKGNRTIPVKFQMHYVGGEPETEAVVQFGVYQVNDEVAAEEPIEYSTYEEADTGPLFRYDEEGDIYIYNFSTKGLASGTYRLVASLPDGQSITEDIMLK